MIFRRNNLNGGGPGREGGQFCMNNVLGLTFLGGAGENKSPSRTPFMRL